MYGDGRFMKFKEGSTMDGNLPNLMAWLILSALFLLAVFVIPGLMVRRAVSQVIKIFRKNHSLCSEGFRTIEELGLKPLSFFERLSRFKLLRDYKPYALQAMIQMGMVRLRDHGKVCLLEDRVPHG
jgi:hypothetical protein